MKDDLKAELIEAQTKVCECLKEKIELRGEISQLRQEKDELMEVVSRVLNIANKEGSSEIIAILQEFF